MYETLHIAKFIPHAAGYPVRPTTSRITRKNRLAIMPFRSPMRIMYSIKYSNLTIRDTRNDNKLYMNRQENSRYLHLSRRSKGSVMGPENSLPMRLPTPKAMLNHFVCSTGIPDSVAHKGCKVIDNN